MTTPQIIAQVIGFLGTIMVIFGMQQKQYKHIVMCKIGKRRGYQGEFQHCKDFSLVYFRLRWNVCDREHFHDSRRVCFRNEEHQQISDGKCIGGHRTQNILQGYEKGRHSPDDPRIYHFCTRCYRCASR